MSYNRINTLFVINPMLTNVLQAIKKCNLSLTWTDMDNAHEIWSK